MVTPVKDPMKKTLEIHYGEVRDEERTQIEKSYYKSKHIVTITA